mmetsp:Transcript_23119/g.34520  ORF Transcript_23119/g.34520 Transcript_23119/m.34520 type:complete len:680 (-) Transcript_23119:102-2141(-)
MRTSFRIIMVASMAMCASKVMTAAASRAARANHNGFSHQLMGSRINTLPNRLGVGRRALSTSDTSRLAFVANSSRDQRINCRHNNLRKEQRSRQFSASTERRQSTTSDVDTGEFYANAELYPDFNSIGISSESLLDRLSSPPLNLKRPSAVQAAAFDTISRGENTIVGAETGSGKTLAYLLPLVEDVLKRKREWKAKNDGEGIMDPGYEYARAFILVPNKELAHQAVRMAASICGGLENCVIWGAEGVMAGASDFSPSEEDVPEEDIVRLAVFPGGLSAPQDFAPFRYSSSAVSSQQRQPPPDLVFATPAVLGPLALSPRNVELFADVDTLVVDEADMLLDGGYVRQLNNVLMGFRRADRLVGRYDAELFARKKSEEVGEEDDAGEDDEWFEGQEDSQKQQKKTQHIFVAATLPDYGLRSVDAYLNKKFPGAVSITMAGMHNARHYGLENDNETCWNELFENKDRMKRLVDVLRLDRSEVGVDGRGLMGEKVMVFLNSVNDVDGATNGLRRAGINAVPYHAKIPLQERTSNLDKFRRYIAPESADEETSNQGDTVPVLVCTDLAARGLDIPGVTAVVQLQFAGNVVSHLHRMGRCGRAGNRDGRGIIFYGPQEAELVAVVREAEKEQSRMELSQDVEEELEDEDNEAAGKVKKAFSRKRGFTKKLKKERREMRESDDSY